MDTLSISSLRARHLPRTLLRAPSPSLEFHTVPGSPPHTTLPPPTQNTTTPSWPETITHTLPSHDSTVGFVIRDTPYPHPPLAHLTISPRRTLTQGWFPLHSHQNLPAGELFVSLFCSTRCASRPIPEAPDFPALPITPDRHAEKRSVSPEPGRLFRSGRLRLAITADGVPASARPHVKVTMSDQVVIGGEIEDPSGPSDKESDAHSLTERRTQAEAIVSDVLRAGLRTGKKLEPAGKTSVHAGKAIIKGAGRFRNRLTGGDPSEGSRVEEVNNDSHVVIEQGYATEAGEGADGGKLQVDEEPLDEKVLQTPENSVVERHSRPMRKFSFRKHGVRRTEESTNEVAEIQERKQKRSADFGSFELALFHGVNPDEICIRVQDGSSHLPEALTLLTEQKLLLPDLKALKCFCEQHCNTHILTFQMSDRGKENDKIVLRITVESTTWAPIATDTIVTPRFRELMSSIDNMAETFKETFPNAENLTYLLVGGLFTQHYPTYFEKNKQFLQEKLRLPRVQTIPIHTEGSIARNAKIIRDSILKTCRGSKSVVLIGHSKGGVDAVSILDSFPETIRFLYGIITFQAPFGGTFLVDFVTRSRLATTAISSVIESIWKGDQDSLLDMGYSARAKSLNIRDLQTDGDSRLMAQLTANFKQTELSPVVLTATEDKLRYSGPGKEAQDCLHVYQKVPIVAVASYASFDILGIRSAANAAGVASMSPAAQRIVKHTGFLCDGLVTAGDGRIPHADTVLLKDMMHTEPALYVQGTRYPPGQLTASAMVLLFEKVAQHTLS